MGFIHYCMNRSAVLCIFLHKLIVKHISSFVVGIFFFFNLAVDVFIFLIRLK